MKRVIRPNARLIQEFVYRSEQLPTDRPVVQYIRQSTDTQVKDNEDSTFMQDEELAERLTIMGFSEIIRIDTDQGISGQKRIDERSGLAYLYKLIETGKVGAVAAYDASRLWRDTTHVWYNTFIEDYLKRYNVPVIFSGEDDVRIFWPKRQQDMDMLREEFKQAAFYLRHIEKLNEAKKRAIEKRVSYGGGSVPFGYVLATTRILVAGKLKKRNYYVIYPPHAALVQWLFKRFKELGGNLARLGRELRDMHFTFPAFSGVEKIPQVSLRFNGVGYPLRTRDALLSILTNPAYIGWYCYNGVVISKTAHDPIVDYDVFLYAYSRLSSTTLDGQPNEDKPKLERRFVNTPALLEGILESDGHPVYAMAASKAYTARLSRNSWTTHEFSIDIDRLDSAFRAVILTLLVSLEQRAKEGLQDSLYTQLQTLQQEKHEEVISFDTALASIDKAIHGWELDKQSSREMGNKVGLDEANRQLVRLYADKTALLEKVRSAKSTVVELQKTQSLLHQALYQWDELTFDNQKNFVRLLIAAANMTKVAPRIIRIDITLKEPLAGVITGHFYMDTIFRTEFTADELATIKRLYSHADRLDILKTMPTKSWLAIRQLAQRKGWQRVIRPNSSDFHEEISYADALVMAEVGLERNKAQWVIPQVDIVTAFTRAASLEDGDELQQNIQSLSRTVPRGASHKCVGSAARPPPGLQPRS